MSFSIQTNVNTLIAQENLRVNSNFQSQTIQRLTSGYRINQSGDDAAGLAIANKFRTDTAELSQGIRNANDGISTLQIIDGGMNNVSKMLDRLRTLSAQSASDTYSGDRSVLDSEFQSLLSEIDRQATSIGLGQGGQFAKALGVYIGGGKTLDGDLSTVNGSVAVNLTSSTVDAKSLGLKGFQVKAGSVDIGDGAGDTTVAKIKANQTNGTSGTTSFYFAGPGFSDNSKVQVSVNLSSVTNLDTLVTAINAAIQNAGNGTSQAATAFKEAGISASVLTNTDGTKQLAFTSSTSAFQVEAGDRMSNALMGSFADTTTALGKSITTTLDASHAYDATGADPITATTVRITGAGLDTPKDFVLTSTTVGAAVTELLNAVNTDGDLQRAGISLADNGGTLRFTNTRGESFSVEATGDRNNRLGLGSFLKDSFGAVDYTAFTAGAYDETSAATYGTAKLEISLNSAGSETPIAIDLFGGNASAGSASSGAPVANDGYVIDSTNHTIGLTLDGVVSNVTLVDSTVGNEAIKVGTMVTGDLDIDIAAATGGSIATQAGTMDYSVAANCNFSAGGLGSKTFTVSVDGDTAQTVVLDANYNNVAGVAGAIAAQLSGVNIGVTANSIVITSKTTGTGGTVQMGGADRATLGFADAVAHLGVNGNNTLSYSVDGGAAQSVTLANGTYTGATLLTEIQGKLGAGISAGFAGATAGFTGTQYAGLGGVLTFKSSSGLGADNSIVFNAVANSANTVLGLVAPTTTARGTDTQTFTLADIADRINATIGAAGTATAEGGVLTIETATIGTHGSVQITASNGIAQFGLATGTHLGVNRDVDDIVSSLNQTFTTNAHLQAAGMKASNSAGTVKIESMNNSYFRVSAAGSDATADMGFGVVGTTFVGANQAQAASSNATVLDAQGTSYIKNDGGVVGISFSALVYGNDDQALTISANDPAGAMKSKTITLSNDANAARFGRNIDEAIAYINDQLQETNIPTLQSIVAVKDNSGGTEKINFLSSLSSFNVALGSSANSDGMALGVATTYNSKTNGSAGNVSISTQLGAMDAVVAVANAVRKLGNAQAAVGKGQNQLNYAVGLAQSQIANYSAAESRIRDADVAAEAANLTKASVLQQASMAAMAQANSAPQAVLALLRG